MTDRFVIVTGGECRIDGIAPNIADGCFVIAADSGFDTAVRLGIKPSLLVGDMDSILRVPSNIELVRVKAEKDVTDTMLAVDIALERGAKHITVIGGAGGRADHWLSNILMLESYSEKGIDIRLIDGTNEIFVLCDGQARIPNNDGYFGIIALCDCTVTESGCKYPLERAQLRRNLPYAVSNEVVGEFAEITIEGHAVITVSKK